jgi:hypothetical protein
MLINARGGGILIRHESGGLRLDLFVQQQVWPGFTAFSFATSHYVIGFFVGVAGDQWP